MLRKQEIFVPAEVRNSAGFSFVYLTESHMLHKQTETGENTVSADKGAPACQAHRSHQHTALTPGQPNASLAAGISLCARRQKHAPAFSKAPGAKLNISCSAPAWRAQPGDGQLLPVMALREHLTLAASLLC